MVHFGELLKIWSLRSKSVTRQLSFLIWQKLVENVEIKKKIHLRHFQFFETMCFDNIRASIITSQAKLQTHQQL